jgi:hypothetical protein
MKWLSWFNYAFELLAVNQWRGLGNIQCPAASDSSSTTTAMPSAGDHYGQFRTISTYNETAYCQGFENGDAVLRFFSFRQVHFFISYRTSLLLTCSVVRS